MHTQSTDVKSKKVEQGEATRHALLDAARTLFGEQGYAATSLDEVVSAANVTKGALYHHFAGKQQLFAAVYEQVKREVSERAARCGDDPPSGKPLRRGRAARRAPPCDPHRRRATAPAEDARADAQRRDHRGVLGDRRR
jgi:AcrR family transcriptional regulator